MAAKTAKETKAATKKKTAAPSKRKTPQKSSAQAKYKRSSEQIGTDSPSSDSMNWETLFRGQVMGMMIQKTSSFISLADQKAQAMIILNSILIPVALNWIEQPVFQISAAVAIVTAITSILTSILCIYPKRRSGKKNDGTHNHFHFGDIGRMDEATYLKVFNPIFNERSRLAEETVKDLHDISRNILLPKYFWLKLSYKCFFIGNLIAIAIAVHAGWDATAHPLQ